jgi:23S rRNA (uracil1939-C5)-methyltransferase
VTLAVSLRAEGLVHGGEVLARHEGQVVFLRGASPGDLVEAALETGGKGYLRGRVLRVLEAGASRVEAPCPLVERCGGCPLQPISHEMQLREKQRLIADALERLGGVPPGSYQLDPILPSPALLRYRRRARLHAGPDGTFGFSGETQDDERGRATLPIDTCLLFEPFLQETWNRVREELAALDGLPGVLDLGLETSGSRAAIDLATAGPLHKRIRHRIELLVRRVPAIRGATVGPDGPAAKAIVGEPVLVDPEARIGAGVPFRLRVRPDLFAQANRAAVPLLQKVVLERLGDAAKGRILELFCGSGTLTLPLLAQGAAEVIGVEWSAAALDLLRRSADEARVGGARLRLLAGDAAQLAGSLRAPEQGRLDAVLLDPPRIGAPAAVRAAAELQAPKLVYVSCDAPTLARDARALAQAGYRLARVQPVDLFPQTAHLEVVAEFVR